MVRPSWLRWQPYLLLASLLLVTSCSTHTGDQAAAEDAELRRIVGQKLMLDLRYFCAEPRPETRCLQPVLSLPPALAEVLRRGQIGGVILFAENIQSAAQTMTLIAQMQQVMQQAGLPPLLIAVDQEGGRVARLPSSMLARFSGNMALGASHPVYGRELATQVAELQGARLQMLGFNVNFAPTVDVNINPLNPVINVRSYGESPQLVADLGQATVAGLQQQGIASALKHFPGHGDTVVDSHIGLPRVDHDRATIAAVDLWPFQQIIASATPPALLMTAHIQYPALDASTFTSNDGEQIVVPATMSRRIMTDLLRTELGYQGVTISDALDMAGVAKYYDELAATLGTFAAGVDIALMPFKIRHPDDIEAFWSFQQQLLQALRQQDRHELEQSAARIAQLKQTYVSAIEAQAPLAARIEAFAQLDRSAEWALQAQLAQAASSLIYDRGVLPLQQTHWHWLMPDTLRCQAALTALAALHPEATADCLSLAYLPEQPAADYWQDDAVIIVGDISPAHSLAELGGMDDQYAQGQRATVAERRTWLQQVLTGRSQPIVLATLRSPYSASDYLDLAAAATASYDYTATLEADGRVESPALHALVQSLLSNHWPGQLPVSVARPTELLKQ